MPTLDDPRDVLVIDDSDIARAKMTRALIDAGYAVLDLPSPIGATRGVVRHGVRLVVVDIHMPAMSGDKLAALFRDNPRLSEVKVVLVSGLELEQLDDIAEDVGIRRAAIFYHFGSKEDLYAEVLDDVFREMGVELPGDGSATERLEASLARWIDFVAQRPNVARLILREAAGARPGEATSFVLAGKAPGQWFRTLVDDGIASGEFEPRVETDRFMGLMASIAFFHFAAMAWLTHDAPVDPLSREELVKHKHELWLVARNLLGVDTSAQPEGAAG